MFALMFELVIMQVLAVPVVFELWNKGMSPALSFSQRIFGSAASASVCTCVHLLICILMLVGT